MGICQNGPDKNIVYITKSLLDKVPGVGETNFYFSTEPLNKLDADCLFILNECQSLKKNAFIRSIPNKSSVSAICKELNSKGIEAKESVNGNLVFYNNSINGLEFNRMAIMFLSESIFQNSVQAPKGQTTVNNIKDTLSNNIRKIVQHETVSLVITEINWKNWVNKNLFFRILCESVIASQKFKSVVFACSSEDSLNHSMKLVQEVRDSGIK